MDEFPCILFHMDPDDTDSPGFPIRQDLHMTILSQRHLILGYLISLWKIWIEIVLSRKKTLPGDRAMGRKPHFDGELHSLLIHRGKRSWKTRTDRAGMGIRISSEGCGTGAEDLRFGEQLGMHLKSNDRLVLHPLPSPDRTVEPHIINRIFKALSNLGAT